MDHPRHWSHSDDDDDDDDNDWSHSDGVPTKQIGSPAHILTAIHEPIIMMMTHMMMRAMMVMTISQVRNAGWKYDSALSLSHL